MDVGCAVMVLLLAVVDEGLAAGFTGTDDLDALRAALGIPPEVTPAGVIPIGHRAPDVPSPSLKRGRKPEGEYVHRERWWAARRASTDRWQQHAIRAYNRESAALSLLLADKRVSACAT